MMKKIPCPKCDGFGHISVVGENSISGYQCDECCGTGQIEVPMTNADRIRAMTDEELADFMTRRNVTESCLRLADKGYTPTEEQKQALYDSLYPVWMQWLQQPAEET